MTGASRRATGQVDVHFVHGPLHQDGPVRLPFWDVLLRLEAEFWITIDSGDTLFHEPNFPVVELAVDFRRWLQGSRETFSFDATDYETPGLIRFEPRGRFATIATPFDRSTLVNRDSLAASVQEFVDSIATAVTDAGWGWDDFLRSEPTI